MLRDLHGPLYNQGPEGEALFTTLSTIASWRLQLKYFVKIVVILKSYRPLSPIAEYDAPLLLEVLCVLISSFKAETARGVFHHS